MKQFVLIAFVLLGCSCAQAQVLSGMLNHSAKVLSYNSTCGCMTLNSTSALSAGDRVLLIQMQGASVSTENNDGFGFPTNYGSCGKFEFNTIASVSASTVTLSYSLSNSFDYQNGGVQMVKVVTGGDLTVGNLVAKKWDGSTGGVIVVEVSNTLTITAKIDASGCGFRGAISTMGSYNCGARNFAYSSSSLDGAPKGEGIAVNVSALRGRGAWANGGGGGNNHNAGGAGGSNAMSGGFGGFAWGGCPTTQDAATRGIGGYALNLTSNDPRVYLGGGGGAGHRNDNNPSNGANGGGIVILVAKTIISSNGGVSVRGSDALRCEMDGAGGGGAGGSVVIMCDNLVNNFIVDTRGGNGGDARNPHGPGGGGSAGVLFVRHDRVPTEISLLNNGGSCGSNYELGGAANGFNPSSYGASNGENGLTMTSTRITTNQNIQSVMTVSAGNSRSICSGRPEQLVATVSAGAAPYQYLWSPADGLSSATSERPVASPEHSTTYVLSVRDSKGCVAVDSVRIQVMPTLQVALSEKFSICKGKGVILQPIIAGGSGDVDVQWTPETGLSSARAAVTVASPEKTTTYVLHVRDRNGCSVDLTTIVSVTDQEKPRVQGDSVVCAGTEHVYRVQVENPTQLMWSAIGSTNLVIESGGKSVRVTWGHEGDASLFVSGDIANSCVGATLYAVRVVSQPEVSILAMATSICEGDSALLDAGMFSRYQWSNGATTRMISVTKEGEYSVRVWNSNGCEAQSSSIRVRVNSFSTPKISIIGKIQPCSGESVTLDAGEWSSYLWSTGETTRMIQPTHSGAYSVTVSNGSGCRKKSDEIRIAVASDFAPALQGATRVCAHSTEVYRADGLSDSYFSWNIDGAEDVQYLGRRNDSVRVQWAATPNGRVRVIENAFSGCEAKKDLTVEIHAPVKPVIEANRVEMFNDETSTLDAGSGYSHYLWSTGATTQKITVQKAAAYTVTVTNNEGCSITSDPLTLVVRQRDAARVVSSALSVCDGEMVILHTSAQYSDVQWSTGERSESIHVDGSGVYFYRVTLSSGGMMWSDTVTVRIASNPQPVITRRDGILFSSPAPRYQWFVNGSLISGATNVSYEPTLDGVYTVLAMHSASCSRLSDPIPFQAVVHLSITAPVLRATVGSTVSMSINIQYDELNAYDVPCEYSMTVRVNKTLVRVSDSNIPTMIDGNDLLITLSGKLTHSRHIDVPCEILLGDTTLSAIRITDVRISDSSMIVVQDGELQLQGSCSQRQVSTVAFGPGLHIASTYPNPCTDRVTVAYELTESGNTELSIIDMSGTVSEEVFHAYQQSGSHEVVIPTTTLASGDYTLVLRSPSRSTSRTFSVVR